METIILIKINSIFNNLPNKKDPMIVVYKPRQIKLFIFPEIYLLQMLWTRRAREEKKQRIKDWRKNLHSNRLDYIFDIAVHLIINVMEAQSEYSLRKNCLWEGLESREWPSAKRKSTHLTKKKTTKEYSLPVHSLELLTKHFQNHMEKFHIHHWRTQISDRTLCPLSIFLSFFLEFQIVLQLEYTFSKNINPYPYQYRI